MLTLKQAAKTLGMTPRQLRRRIEATRPVVAPYIRRGEKNRLLLDYGAIEILRAVEERRANGATLREATREIADSIRGNHRGELGYRQGANSDELPKELPKGDPWKLLLDEKDARIRALEDEVAFLRRRIEELTARALPPPRRRWWWPFRQRASA